MQRARHFALPLGLALACAAQAVAAEPVLSAEAQIERVLLDVRTWRRDIHQHPELSNREVRTAKLVATHLAEQGYEVRTGVAHTGVIGVLRGGPGPVVALRADMDALPVVEETGLVFASRERATYAGRDVGVMHACGHDAHTAILMGVAEVLAARRAELAGTVVLLFQPAEEGAPSGELPVGRVGVRSGAAMASSDRLTIRVKGRQSHAAYPWQGVDPIAAAARIVLALEALPARDVDARIPSVVSIGAFHGGVRHNILPGDVELLGTIRALDTAQRTALHEKVRRTAEGMAQASGAEAEVEIDEGNPMVWNDPALLTRMRPALERAAGAAQVEDVLPWTASEDFAFYQQQVPGVFFWLGVRPEGVAPADATPLHTPRFVLDEAALPLGVRAMTEIAVSFLESVR